MYIHCMIICFELLLSVDYYTQLLKSDVHCRIIFFELLLSVDFYTQLLKYNVHTLYDHFLRTFAKCRLLYSTTKVRCTLHDNLLRTFAKCWLLYSTTKIRCTLNDNLVWTIFISCPESHFYNVPAKFELEGVEISDILFHESRVWTGQGGT